MAGERSIKQEIHLALTSGAGSWPASHLGPLIGEAGSELANLGRFTRDLQSSAYKTNVGRNFAHPRTRL